MTWVLAFFVAALMLAMFVAMLLIGTLIQRVERLEEGQGDDLSEEEAENLRTVIEHVQHSNRVPVRVLGVDGEWRNL